MSENEKQDAQVLRAAPYRVYPKKCCIAPPAPKTERMGALAGVFAPKIVYFGAK